MNNILVTGGLGFVGSQLALHLGKRTCRVTLLDNLLSQPDLQRIELPKNVQLVIGDIRDRKLVRELIRMHDVVVHLAGVVGYPACDLDPDESYDINVNGTRTLYEDLTLDHRLIFVSSTSVYGHQTELVDETSTPKPLTSYGNHKIEGEYLTTQSKAWHIIFRPATAFGVSQRLRIDLLPNTLAYSAVNDKHIRLYQPNVIRPFHHVIDFARVIEFAIDNNLMWNQLYNVGNPDLTMTKEQMASKFAQWANAEIEIVPGSDPDQRNYDVSFNKLLDFGFQYLPDTLELGFEQIQSNTDDIRKYYSSFESPAQFDKYLEIRKHS